MELPSSQNDLGVRFGFLLQPIKDLSKNFDIDLDSHLGDYLSEIAKITISFNNGITPINFAEAALIIQGSASVYCQKVEYLYRLTFGVLELISNRKQHQQGRQRQSTDAVEKTHSDASEENFISLDDINEGVNTFMKNDNQDGPHASIIAPLTPSVLLRLDDADRAERPLLSRNGEVLGSMNDFRMNTSLLHSTGALIFDLSHLQHFNPTCNSSPIPTSNNLPVAESVGAEAGGVSALQQRTDVHPPDNCDGGENFLHDFDDASDGVEMADNLHPDQQPVVATNRRELRQKPREKQLRLVTDENLRDMWNLLDAHQGSEKPCKKGKVFRIPDGISSGRNKKRKHSRPPDVQLPLIPFCQLWNNNYFSRLQSKKGNFPKGFTFMDFEGHFWELSRKQKQLYSQKRIRRNAFVTEERGEEEGNPPLMRDDDDDNDDNGGCAVEGDDDDHAVMENIEIPDMHFPDLLDEDCNDPALAVRQNDVGIILSDASVSLTYEELVQRYTEGFLDSARLYIQDTALTQRVAEWEKRIVPRLQEEETRRPFDIHEYGSEVIEKIDSLGGSIKPVTFHQVVERKPMYEVCRYFLATLQLANFGNVELGRTSNKELGMDDATCKLLSRHRHFEALTDYRVPSLKQK